MFQAVCAYGGSPIKDQIAELKKGAEIIVCTPGRMIDLLTANSGRVTNLKRVTYVVLDEADRMFDMGFEPQVMKIVNNIRPDRQTVLFSATFPKQMDSLARKILQKPLEITVGGRSVVAAEIEQIVEVRSEDSKFNRLLEILGQMYNEDSECRTLIFVDRQEAADNLLRDLMRKGYLCMSLHGGKDQVDRDSTIADFKSGVVPIVIATSVAARGLDVKQLKLVINYDAPNHMEDYVHRAGRTGRAGNKGTCVTFITPEQERYSVDIYRALKASNAATPNELEELANGVFTLTFFRFSAVIDTHYFPQASWRRSRQGKPKLLVLVSVVRVWIVLTRSERPRIVPSVKHTASQKMRKRRKLPRHRLVLLVATI
jgi:ATP-dependent RNA helicase DDX46/PRP5